VGNKALPLSEGAREYGCKTYWAIALEVVSLPDILPLSGDLTVHNEGRERVCVEVSAGWKWGINDEPTVR
jgi:hypothetical protein